MTSKGRSERGEWELRQAWLELTRLLRLASELGAGLSAAGLSAEAETAARLGASVHRRLAEVTKALDRLASDQPRI